MLTADLVKLSFYIFTLSYSCQVLAGLLDEQDDGARAAASGMDWLDNLSESASSNLSKIDWAAIERMVAAEEG